MDTITTALINSDTNLNSIMYISNETFENMPVIQVVTLCGLKTITLDLDIEKAKSLVRGLNRHIVHLKQRTLEDTLTEDNHET